MPCLKTFKNLSYLISLKEQRDVIDTLINRTTGSRQKYSPELRAFCLRMQFYSTAGYNELRKFFGNRLPTVATIHRWLRCVDASPGITQSSLDEIAEKAREYRNNGKKLHLCMMSDEMSMRKQILWNPDTKKFHGFSTEENSNSKKPRTVSKDALVFMAVGSDFKIPVAYFLLSGIRAIDRAALTREVITGVCDTGAKVVSLTGDGLSANITVAKLLGADFKSKKPFISVRPNEKIYIILDPPHMLKLIRKYFAQKKLFYKDEELKWSLIEKLAQKQDNDNFEMGNKLSRAHITFSSAPMNVLLAAQTLSNSVADSLEQLCEDEYPEYIGCEPTVKFLRLFNDTFDVMNYGNGKPSNEYYKQPLCAANIENFSRLFEEFEEFISHITVAECKRSKKNKNPSCIRKPVLKSKSSCGFFGFLVNIQSILGIYRDYVENGPFDTFDTFQFSQDHLETFFSLIRASLGC